MAQRSAMTRPNAQQQAAGPRPRLPPPPPPPPPQRAGPAPAPAAKRARAAPPPRRSSREMQKLSECNVNPTWPYPLNTHVLVFPPLIWRESPLDAV